MKKKFSRKWIASKQPRKKRKYRANAPQHIKAKMLASNLSKELREKYQRRSLAIRKGDSVKITRGKFKTKKGKVGSVNLSKLKVVIEGLQRAKKDGTKVNVLFDPSNLQIQELNLDDKMRMKSINKEEAGTEEKKKGEKDKTEAVKEKEKNAS